MPAISLIGRVWRCLGGVAAITGGGGCGTGAADWQSGRFVVCGAAAHFGGMERHGAAAGAGDAT